MNQNGNGSSGDRYQINFLMVNGVQQQVTGPKELADKLPEMLKEAREANGPGPRFLRFDLGDAAVMVNPQHVALVLVQKEVSAGIQVARQMPQMPGGVPRN